MKSSAATRPPSIIGLATWCPIPSDCRCHPREGRLTFPPGGGNCCVPQPTLFRAQFGVAGQSLFRIVAASLGFIKNPAQKALESELAKEEEISMRLVSKVLAICIVFAVVASGAHAQGICGLPPTPNSPVQYVSDDVFNQMLGGGSLISITPEFCAEAVIGGLFQYLQDEAYVADYLQRNPELTDLAALAASTPNPNDPYVQPNQNGTYDVTIFNSAGSF